jgi:hypothetical protein
MADHYNLTQMYLLPAYMAAVLRIRIRDPGAFLTPGTGMGRKSASGSGIRDEQPGSYFLELRNHIFGFFGVKILNFFDEDPGSGMETVRIRDGKKVGSGIRDKHPGSASQLTSKYLFCSLTSMPMSMERLLRAEILPLSSPSISWLRSSRLS